MYTSFDDMVCFRFGTSSPQTSYLTTIDYYFFAYANQFCFLIACSVVSGLIASAQNFKRENKRATPSRSQMLPPQTLSKLVSFLTLVCEILLTC